MNISPVDAARLQLRNNWQQALQILQSSYDPATARDAWIALLSEPNSGWSTRDPQSGAWRLYCVPGYDALCGDFNFAAQPVSAPQYAYAPQPMQMQQYVPAAGQAASTGMTTGQKWTLFFVVIAGAWFLYMMRPESEAEKREYRAAHRNRRMVTT